jgi:dipeptidyl aminopeptidase/acylaminoacyl peptidase
VEKMLKTNLYLTSYLLGFLMLGVALTQIQPDNYGRIAFVSDRDNLAQIYVMDADGSNQVNITHNYFENSNPEWSPDGERIVFAS